MLKSPQVNGNTKSVLPREFNVEITCGCLDTFWEESEKNSDVPLNMNQNLLLMEIGTDQDVTLTSLPLKPDQKEDYNI